MVGSLRRIPAWAWLAVVVLVSFAFRAWLARDMLGPFIMVDELIYSELGRSLAASGELLVRDVPSPGYGVVYPLLVILTILVTGNHFLFDAVAGLLVMAVGFGLAALVSRLWVRDDGAILEPATRGGAVR